MKKPVSILILLLLPVLPAVAKKSGTIAYSKQSFVQAKKAAIKGGSATASLRIFYPHLTRTPSPKLTRRINAFIRQRTLAPVVGDKTAPSLAVLYNNYYKAFVAYTKKAEHPLSWEMTRSFSVQSPSPGKITIVESWYAFTGGAHPNSQILYYAFKQGKGRLKVADLLKTGTKKSFTKTAELYFRRARNLNPGMSLQKSGLWFKKGFQVNENFLLTARGLRFHFNSYEIAPYAWGPSTYTIPYTALKPYLKAEFFPDKKTR